jgi:hypothetical protein
MSAVELASSIVVIAIAMSNSSKSPNPRSFLFLMPAPQKYVSFVWVITIASRVSQYSLEINRQLRLSKKTPLVRNLVVNL